MKKRIIATGACSAMFIIAFLATIFLLKSTSPNDTAKAVEAAALAAVETEAESDAGGEDVYILKEYMGNICVFHGDYEDIPAFVTEIPLDSLTTSDRELLFQGIKVFGREELLKLLEDFGS